MYILLLPSFRLFIEGHQINNRRTFCPEVWKFILKMGNQHSELSSPIADVIETKDVMAKELEESSNAVTNDGGPDVEIFKIFLLQINSLDNY